MIWQPALGAALVLLRSRRNLKQLEVAAAAGITNGMLSSFERGAKTPSLGSLGSILSALGADLRELQEILDSLEPALFAASESNRARAQAVAGLTAHIQQMGLALEGIATVLQILEGPSARPPHRTSS